MAVYPKSETDLRVSALSLTGLVRAVFAARTRLSARKASTRGGSPALSPSAPGPLSSMAATRWDKSQGHSR
jgi:hypothetical protein